MRKSRKEDEIVDDLCVRREEIEKLFHPPPAKATFHRWVNEEVVVMARGLSGYFLLNRTRVRLGMPPVDVNAYRESLVMPEQQKPEVPDEAVVVEAPIPSIRAHPPQLMTVKEAAKYLTVSPASMHRELKAGRIRFARLGRRILIRSKDLDIYVENNLAGAWLEDG